MRYPTVICALFALASSVYAGGNDLPAAPDVPPVRTVSVKPVKKATCCSVCGPSCDCINCGCDTATQSTPRSAYTPVSLPQQTYRPQVIYQQQPQYRPIQQIVPRPQYRPAPAPIYRPQPYQQPVYRPVFQQQTYRPQPVFSGAACAPGRG